MKSPTSAPVQADQACSPTLPGESVSSGPGPHRRVFTREDLVALLGQWNPAHLAVIEGQIASTRHALRHLESPATRMYANKTITTLLRGIAIVGEVRWPDDAVDVLIELGKLIDGANAATTRDLMWAIERDFQRHVMEILYEQLALAASMQALHSAISHLAQGPAAPAQAPCEAGSHPSPAPAAAKDPNLSGQGAEAPTADRLPTLAAGGVSSDSAAARGGSLANDREQP